MASFQYCLNSSTIKPTPILQKIQVAAEAGYAGIELWHDDIDLYVESGGTVEDVRKCLDDHGLVAPTTIFLKGWWDTDGDDYTTAIDEIKRRLAQSAIVGAPHAIAGPPLTVCDHTLGGQRYAALLEVGREFGVRPAAEYLGFADDINTIEDALEIMDGSSDTDATIVLDPFHCFRGGGPIESIDKLTADRIAISHFNDSPADPPRASQHDRDRVMPGDGIVDLKLYCDKLREIGYDRWMSLELFHPGYWEQDPLETAKIGLEKMQAVAEA
ncbi:MAG: sugar phosphate isomerase/epimerase [Planctomycetaceae bacterium]